MFFIFERIFRIGSEAKSLTPTKHDKKSTLLISIAYISSWLILILGVILNNSNIGNISVNIISWFGIFISILGFIIRLIALLYLGKFYTRTVKIVNNHKVISNGIYKYIRHPGYLGVILTFIVAAITVINIYCSIYIVIIMPLSYIYRINVEEQMLKDHFGKEYLNYMSRSWRLLPFIY